MRPEPVLRQRGGRTMVERAERLCAECGEPMVLAADYGVSGEMFVCRLCGYSHEEIDLRETVLDRVG